jgi:hypothetical protein
MSLFGFKKEVLSKAMSKFAEAVIPLNCTQGAPDSNLSWNNDNCD